MAKDLLDSDGSESDHGGVQISNGTDFKVNEDFARKFTHNKKREELRRCMYSGN
jgi:protein KRI1